MSKKLFIGNLSFEVTDQDLSQLFGQCGHVGSAEVVRDRESGRSKGFGFVEMPSDDEATHAVQRMNGYDLKGRVIEVNEAKQKPPGAAIAPSEREESQSRRSSSHSSSHSSGHPSGHSSGRDRNRESGGRKGRR